MRVSQKDAETERPIVSAVIPAYNAAQTYDNIIEVIVVDDGSEDTTAEIVRGKYPDVTLIQQENAGAGAAPNAALRAAAGEYIAFLDADDEWLPRKVARQLEVLRLNPDADFCGCLLEIHTQDGKRTRPWPEVVWDTVELTFASFLGREHPPITVTPIGPRLALQSVGGSDPDMPAFVDLDLWLRVMASGHGIVILQEYLHRWYIQAESLCHGRRGLRKHEAALRILDKWDPVREAEARELLIQEEHNHMKFRALFAASRNHAYYGEDERARSFAKQALAMEGESSFDRLRLQGLALAPAAHRACARAIEGGKNVVRWFQR